MTGTEQWAPRRMSLGYVALIVAALIVVTGMFVGLRNDHRDEHCWVEDGQGLPAYFDYSRPGCERT